MPQSGARNADPRRRRSTSPASSSFRGDAASPCCRAGGISLSRLHRDPRRGCDGFRSAVAAAMLAFQRRKERKKRGGRKKTKLKAPGTQNAGKLCGVAGLKVTGGEEAGYLPMKRQGLRSYSSLFTLPLPRRGLDGWCEGGAIAGRSAIHPLLHQGAPAPGWLGLVSQDVMGPSERNVCPNVPA
ncbi:hypothetical protein PMIN01_03187 [Paraphaeosphaeria minitans]|uniref:Uncharacterized protein n=1 Tax=Paraphaeosphaeria minitans TaxID=565426 RepID=A0A9P6KTL9_9PLEO|nr:hypothetical protein PMIN01_03187 [Paraphaeosphaeria minitans]